MVVVVVVVVMVGSVSTWPIAAPDKDGVTASEVVFLNECGASVTKTLNPTEPLQVLFNVSSSLPAECHISLRVSVKDRGLAKYGLRVFGHLQVSNDDCYSSSLLVHDNDDDTDQAAVSKTFCNTGPIEFRTVEDVILFSYAQREGGGAWQGAAITVVPELVCGGVLTKDTTIVINHYDFRAPYVCNWELLPGEGQMTRLSFEEFSLTVRKKKKCTSECLLFIPGKDMTHYCGTELLGKNRISTREGVDVSSCDSRSNPIQMQGGIRPRDKKCGPSSPWRPTNNPHVTTSTTAAAATTAISTAATTEELTPLCTTLMEMVWHSYIMRESGVLHTVESYVGGIKIRVTSSFVYSGNH
ncbi:uncharacterized protein LOC135093712 isoform X2 [Scylla paramamosain]